MFNTGYLNGEILISVHTVHKSYRKLVISHKKMIESVTIVKVISKNSSSRRNYVNIKIKLSARLVSFALTQKKTNHFHTL